MRKGLFYASCLLLLVVFPIFDVIEYPPLPSIGLAVAGMIVVALCLPVSFGLKEPPRHD